MFLQTTLYLSCPLSTPVPGNAVPLVPLLQGIALITLPRPSTPGPSTPGPLTLGPSIVRRYYTVCKSSLRSYILLTLSHIELTDARKNLSLPEIAERLRTTFVCKSIVISKESHALPMSSSGCTGFHYHVGIWNASASKHTAALLLRKAKERDRKNIAWV